MTTKETLLGMGLLTLAILVSLVVAGLGMTLGAGISLALDTDDLLQGIGVAAGLLGATVLFAALDLWLFKRAFRLFNPQEREVARRRRAA